MCTAAGVLLNMFKQGVKTLFGIVEVENGLEQHGSIEVGQLCLEVSKRLAGGFDDRQVVRRIMVMVST